MKDNGETVFIPMSDLLTGFLFVFIILVLTFISMINEEPILLLDTPNDPNASNVAISSSKGTVDFATRIDNLTIRVGDEMIFPLQSTVDITKGLSDGGQSIGLSVKKKTGKNQELLVSILNSMSFTLAELGITVELDYDNGIMRLPESMLFAKSKYEITRQGSIALKTISAIVDHALKCNTPSDSLCSDPDKGKIEAMLIEGHTDIDPYPENSKIKDNWDLSVFRANTTYRFMLYNQRHLSCYKNSYGLPVIGVSGYGETRPVPHNRSRNEEEKSKNRRIDLRFIMETENDDYEHDANRWPRKCKL